jgi:uncharacterized protein
MANRVIHFEIQADDVERAKDFYQKVFGWEIKQYMTEEKSGMMDYWLIMTGKEGTPGIDGGMYQRPTDDKIFTYDCTVEVEDIDKAIEAVKANGGTIRTDRTGQEKNELKGVGWFAGAIDPEGNRFALMQATGWQPK